MAARRLYRRRLTAYRAVRAFLVGVYALIFVLMVLDLYRVTLATESFIPFYFPTSMAFGLAQAVLLVAAAAGTYVNPMGDSRSFLRDISKKPLLAVLFSVFIAVVAVVIVFALAVPAYSASTAVDFASNVVPSVIVGQGYVLALVGLYAFFICYPSFLLFAAARRVSDPKLRSSLYLLPVGWALVSSLYLSSEPFAWLSGRDFGGLMYMANAVVFFLVTGNFARTAALAGFVNPAEGGKTGEFVPGPTGVSLTGNVLLIVDPTSSYEKSVLDLATSLRDRGNSVFLFTRNGSRLKGVSSPRIRTYLLTSRVSYLKPTDNPSEVLLPEDTAVILDALDKTYSIATEGKVVVFYDSISDMLMSKGMDATYRFVKQAMEMSSSPNATTFFLILKGVHDAKIMNMMSAGFSNQLLCDDNGFTVLK